MKKGWMFGAIFFGFNALLLIFSGITAFLGSNSKKDLNKEVVVLKEARVLPENEGKMVIVAGIPQWNGAEDKYFNIKTDSFVLNRKVEYLVEDFKTGKDSKGNEKESYRYEWKELKEQRKNDEMLRTPSNDRVQTEDFYSEVSLGEFKLDEIIKKEILKFGILEEVKELDENVASSKGMKIALLNPLDASENNPVSFKNRNFGEAYSLEYIINLFTDKENFSKIGKIPHYVWRKDKGVISVEFLRVSFRHYIMNKVRDSGVTIIAHQINGKLSFDKDKAKNGDVYEVALGNLSLDEMIDRTIKSEKKGGIGAIILGILFVPLAVFMLKKSKS